METFVQGASNGVPTALAVDPTSVYWPAYAQHGGGALWSRGLAGGTPQSLASFSIGCMPPIAVDATRVYWSCGPILSVPLQGGTEVTLAAATQANALAVDGQNLYWTDTNLVIQLTLSGGSAVTLSSTQGSSPWGVAVDAQSVYWTDSAAGAVMKVAIGGGTPTTLATGQSGPTVMTVDATSVYWLDRVGLKKAPVGGGATVTLSTVASLPPYGSAGIAVDATQVYWTSYATPAVLRVGLGGGTPVTLSSGGEPMGLAIDANSVFWTDWLSAGVYRRTPK